MVRKIIEWALLIIVGLFILKNPSQVAGWAHQIGHTLTTFANSL